MEALRKLTVEQSELLPAHLIITSINKLLFIYPVREYHGTYYVPHNLSLIVSGKLRSGTTSLLKVVQEKVEPSLVAHGQNKGPRPEGWKRPFVETMSANRGPIKETVKKTVEFPEKDESVGEVMISYMGPSPNEFLQSKVSPFRASFRILYSIGMLILIIICSRCAVGHLPDGQLPHFIGYRSPEQRIRRDRITSLVTLPLSPPLFPSYRYNSDAA